MRICSDVPVDHDDNDGANGGRGVRLILLLLLWLILQEGFRAELHHVVIHALTWPLNVWIKNKKQTL